MNTVMTWQIASTGSEDTRRLGALLASNLPGGSVIELISDLGGGKTTFTQGLARGLGSQDNVVSPTFTLKRVYDAGKLKIFHYDFYRLSDPGILRDELAESIGDNQAITIVEWGDIVADVLPNERLSIKLEPTAHDPDERAITINYPEKYVSIIEMVRTKREEIEP